MIVTGRSICTRALKSIGAVGEGQTPTPGQLVDAFDDLNEMLDGWRIDRGAIAVVERAVYSLVSGTQTYTIGDGGDFNRDRPDWIDRASIIDNSDPTQPLEMKIPVLTEQEWQSVALKLVESSYPGGVYYDFAYPLGNLSFYPIPDTSDMQVALYCAAPLAQFATLDTEYDIPPGNRRALRYNLAIEIAPDYGVSIEEIPIIQAKAAEYLGDLRRVNTRVVQQTADSALINMDRRRSGRFSILTGDL